jgi:hypothetical protein
MEKEVILNKIKEAITEVSRANVNQIHPTDKINQFVPEIDAQSLALVIWKHFNKLDTTDLLSSLFGTISEIADLVSYIQKKYES